MPHAFKPNAPSTLIPGDQHIRYIREVHAGKPISMTACVLEVGDVDAVIYQDMRHSDGRCAAAFRTRVIHANAKTGAPFPWSKRSRAALEELIDTPPEDTAPRSLDPKCETLSREHAVISTVERTGAPLVGLGLVPPEHCDVFGRMYAPRFIGRISDSVPNLLFDWRQQRSRRLGRRRSRGRSSGVLSWSIAAGPKQVICCRFIPPSPGLARKPIVLCIGSWTRSVGMLG